MFPPCLFALQYYDPAPTCRNVYYDISLGFVIFFSDVCWTIYLGRVKFISLFIYFLKGKGMIIVVK